jgi:hypothetical protein
MTDDQDSLPTPQELNENIPQFCITYNKYLSEKAHHNFIWKFFQETNEISNHQSLFKVLKIYLDKS